MKYTILINQKAIIENGINIDLIDASIFDFIKDFSHSPKCETIQILSVKYFWISHTLIIENLPLLGIKSKRGIQKRIDNLVETGLLKRHPDCKQMARTYYCFGDKYEAVTFCASYEQKFRGATNKSSDPPTNKSSEDNIYKNDTIISDTNGELENSLFPDFTIDKRKKTIYRNCDLKKEGVLREVFKNEIAAGIDVQYYATRVEWWSNTKEGLKRGFYGWRDTINKFMSEAKEAGKLKMLETEPKEESEFARRYREKVEGMK